MYPFNPYTNDATKKTTQIRQSDDDASYENGNYKYTTLINRSDSDISTRAGEFVNKKDSNFLMENKMIKSSSDQKIPDTARHHQYGSLKNELNLTSPKSKDICKEKNSALICTDLILEVYKSNKENLKTDEEKLNTERDQLMSQDRQSGRSVPNHELDPSMASLNLSSNSYVQRDANGNVIINTSLGFQEPCSDFTPDHVKYINLFTILCCWCFPITGILGIIFARLTKKYYEMRDWTRAKKFLNRAEWMLLLTFFFGCTLIAVIFALMEFYWFKSGSQNVSRGVYHIRSLPK